MELELTVENVTRKGKPGRGDPPHFARSPATLAERDASRETPSGSGTFLGPVTTEAAKEAVERGGRAGFFSDPLRTLAVEQHSRHSVDSFASADCLLADSDGGGVGSGGVSTNGRSSTSGGGEGGGGTGLFSDPLRTLTVKQHSRHSVDSFASADCLLADSSGGGREGIGGGICNDGRLSSDGERLTDGGGGVAAITHGEMMESRERGREEEEEEGGAAGSMPLRRDDNYGEGWPISRGARFLSVVAFWLSHTSSVYATKALLSRPGRTIRSVVVITWCQCMASFILVLTLGTLGERQDAVDGAWRSPFLTEMAKALPTNALLGGWNSKSLLGGGAEAVGLASVLFCLAVFADNACLGAVNASFFQVSRALTLPFVVFMGAVGARALPPRDVLLPCALCVAGFSLGVHSQTPEAFADGTSMGVMASLLTAAYTLLLARAEPREAWKVTYVTNRNASVLLVPVAVYVGMGDPAYLSRESFLFRDRSTILLTAVAMVLPAVAGVSTMWQAHAGLGAKGQAASFVGRAAFSHMFAFQVFGNSPVAVGEIGCCLVLTGLGLYASFRGGTAVAQAGNVAVPGAAREHFPSSGPTSSAAAEAAAAAGGVGSPRHARPSDLGKRKTSDLGRGGYCALDEGDDGGARRTGGDYEDDRSTIGTAGCGGTVTNRNGPRSPTYATRRVSEGVGFGGTGTAGGVGDGGGLGGGGR